MTFFINFGKGARIYCTLSISRGGRPPAPLDSPLKPYYYNRPSMIKFIEPMNTPNSKERFRMMLLLKIVFKPYAETLKQ